MSRPSQISEAAHEIVVHAIAWHGCSWRAANASEGPSTNLVDAVECYLRLVDELDGGGPVVYETAYGKWLAVTAPSDPHRIGVIGDTEPEARELFAAARDKIQEWQDAEDRNLAELARGEGKEFAHVDDALRWLAEPSPPTPQEETPR